ncbi:hypothetical protein KIN20_015406 [Parelaphostrongylus tenuis]|uniref:Uncharacterized protein n=1 Tax=Parelaphostrongylus tenuis TaxID=148309 RepID=A0AAD5MEU7_PARTN|nr:hypothetical protein KIN20_015406 [Parelaphostrongylus tenuis]
MDHHHRRHLSERETNGNDAAARTTSEDRPSKYSKAYDRWELASNFHRDLLLTKSQVSELVD